MMAGSMFASRCLFIVAHFPQHLIKRSLCVFVALLGGLAVPESGLTVVLRHALAAGVYFPERELRTASLPTMYVETTESVINIVSFSNLLKPTSRLSVVLRHSHTAALLGGLAVPESGLTVVLANVSPEHPITATDLVRHRPGYEYLKDRKSTRL